MDQGARQGLAYRLAESNEAAAPDPGERDGARGRARATILQLMREIENFGARFVIAVMRDPQSFVPTLVLPQGAPSLR